MPMSVRDLLDLPGLGLSVIAGEAGLDRPIRWVHTSELQDPTPWLKGGEFLLTTGMGLQGSPALQRAYVRRLVAAGLSGLGVGVGFGFDAVPDVISRAADREDFPVLEVPYPVPFIAIAEAVSSRISEDRLRDAQMSLDTHDRLTSMVAEGAGPADVLDEVAALVHGWGVLFDPIGHPIAHTSSAPADLLALWERLPPAIREGEGPSSASGLGPDEAIVALPVVAAKRHEGVVVFGRSRRFDERDRIVVHHAITVLALIMAARVAIVETERRVAGDVLSEAFAGRLTGDDLLRRLELLGFRPGSPVAALVLEGVGDEMVEEVVWRWDRALGSKASAARTAVMGRRIVALVDHPEPVSLADEVVAEVGSILPAEARVGVGEPVPPMEVRRSYVTAALVLKAAGDRYRIVSPHDLGAYGLLLGSQSAPVLEGFVESVLGPLLERDRARGSELVPSVRAFIEAGGRWEVGAEKLGIHRHTLRYRINQAIELLGRDLTSAEDRFQVWLGLKALDVLGQ